MHQVELRDHALEARAHGRRVDQAPRRTDGEEVQVELIDVGRKLVGPDAAPLSRSRHVTEVRREKRGIDATRAERLGCLGGEGHRATCARRDQR